MPKPLRTTSIRSSSGVQPFALGRLVGDLIIRYEMPRERAISVARDLREVLEIVRETKGVDVFDTDEIRRGVDGLLEGETLARLAGVIGRTEITAAPEARFSTPPEAPEVDALADAATAYGLHLLALAERGEGDPALVEAVAAFRGLVERSATKGFEGTPEVKAAFTHYVVRDASATISAQHNPRAEQEFEFTIGDAIRWLLEFLRINKIPTLIGPEDDGDDPRDVPKPTGFGEELTAEGWQLSENLLAWTALRKTGYRTDEMRITSAFSYIGQSGKSAPKNSEFQDDGESVPGNHHDLGRVGLPPNIPGIYMAVHLLSEEDITDPETAEQAADIIVTILGKIANGVLAKGIDLGGAAGGVPLPGAIVDIIAGPAINKACQIIGGKLRQILAKAFGPEIFYPVPVRVLVMWHDGIPEWRVWVQGYYMGMRYGAGELRSHRYPNGMPYTVQHDGPGRYTYSLRFRVG